MTHRNRSTNTPESDTNNTVHSNRTRCGEATGCAGNAQSISVSPCFACFTLSPSQTESQSNPRYFASKKWLELQWRQGSSRRFNNTWDTKHPSSLRTRDVKSGHRRRYPSPTDRHVGSDAPIALPLSRKRHSIIRGRILK